MKIIFVILKMKRNIYSNLKKNFFIKALTIYSKLNYKLLSKKQESCILLLIHYVLPIITQIKLINSNKIISKASKFH